MADYIRPTPRNPLLGLLSDALTGGVEWMRSPQRAQQMQGLGGLLAETGIPATVERMSYGEPLTKGRGMTTRLRPEAEAALMTLAPEAVPIGRAAMAGVRATKGLPVGASIINKPSPFSVYHGSKDIFDEFKPGMGVTAKHIYTTPEGFQQDAAKYGSVMYRAEASPKKMIDFSSEGQLDKSTIAALKKAAKDAGIIDKYHTFDDFMQNVMEGQLYQAYGGQRTQNALLDELLSRFDAVKMPDATSGGGLSKSVVFGDTTKLRIIERDGQPILNELQGGLLAP
jgi:hypothetical protein